MASMEKRHRGSQFIIEFPKDVTEESVREVVACKTKGLGAELKYFIIGINKCVIKVSSELDFRGETRFIVEKVLPSITAIKNKDLGLIKEIKKIKSESTNFRVVIDIYNIKPEKILQDEESGHMFTTIKTNTAFDESVSTKFGRGHRRVEALYTNGRHVGYKFVPFGDYSPQWASDIFGYDSFEDALKDIYPYQCKEIKILKELYDSRPRTMYQSTITLSEWQSKVENILNTPIDHEEQLRDFYWFADLKGKVGKSTLVKHVISNRDDTLVISASGKMSDLIRSVKGNLISSTKIKNLILDIPKEIVDEKKTDIDFHIFDDARHEGDTFKFMESCANGRFASFKYDSSNFELGYGLRVIVLSNSLPLITATSLDRWHINLIENRDRLKIDDLRYDDSFVRIKTRDQVIDFYLSQPLFIKYLQDLGYRTFREKKIKPIPVPMIKHKIE
jgi:hypothetical protein